MNIREINYKGNIIYVVDESFYCLVKKGTLLGECSKSLVDAKEEIDRKERNKLFQSDLNRQLKAENIKNKLSDDESSKNKVKDNTLIVNNLLNKIMNNPKIHSTEIYYLDGYQKKISIQHVSSKKFIVKHSRKAPRTMYYKELFTMLLRIKNNYSTGKWI